MTRFLICVVVAWQVGAASRAEADPMVRRALLIGCGEYGGELTRLFGPANDVALWEKTLAKRDFESRNIVKLVDCAAAERLPTRANILRELDRLADDSKKGDVVFIGYFGHGAQQPNLDPPNVDLEVDGKDELLVPVDAKHEWDGPANRYVGTIVDDEFRVKLDAITKNGDVHVCVVVDACNSGTSTRGETSRRLDFPADVIPAEVRAKAEALRGSAASAATADAVHNDSPPQVAALYAAKPGQAEKEMPLPPDDEVGSKPRKVYGLLTFAMCRVLDLAEAPLTYNELHRRVQAQYAAWGRGDEGPVPLVEGTLAGNYVFAYEQQSKRSILLKKTDSAMIINAGSLSRIMPGTILAVYPPPGTSENPPVQDYVIVKKDGLGVFDSLVERTPPPTGSKAPASDGKILDGSVCEPVSVDWGELRLSVSVERKDQPGVAATALQTNRIERLKTALDVLQQNPQTGVKLVEATEMNGWVVEVDAAGEAMLLPAGERAGGPQLRYSRRIGPIPLETQKTWLGEHIRALLKAANLIKIATDLQNGTAGGRSQKFQFDVEFKRHRDRQDQAGTVVCWQTPMKLHAGDRFSFRVLHKNFHAIDVTFLFIDSAGNVTSYFPKSGAQAENTFGNPNVWVDLPQAKLGGKTLGCEYMLVFALKNNGAPVDLSVFEESTQELASHARGTHRGPESALEKLLGFACYGRGPSRAPHPEIESVAAKVYCWETAEPRPQP